MSESITDLKPVYLIYGPEEMLVDQAAKRFKKRLARLADLDFNFESFDASASPVDDVLGAANTMPFMSERRLVIVRKADAYDKESTGALIEYARDPAPYTLFVMTAERPADDLVKAVGEKGFLWPIEAPKRNEYGSVVKRMFSDAGKNVGTDGAEALVEAVGRDLRRLTVEVGKIVAFVGDAGTVTLEDVERVMVETAPTSVFEFLDAFGARDVRSSLRLLSRVLEDGETVQAVHAMTVRHVRNLLGARAVLDRRGGETVVARELGLQQWQARKLTRQAERWTADELKDALVAAARTEGETKTSRVEPRLALERWLMAAVSR